VNSSFEIVFEVDPSDPLSRIGSRQSDRQGFAGSDREKEAIIKFRGKW